MDASHALGPLINGPFTLEEARSRGLDYRLLLVDGFTRLSRGLYMSYDAAPDLLERVLAHLKLAPESWASHTTAAELGGLWLPESVSVGRHIHLSKPAKSTRVRRNGVIGHHVRVLPGEVVVHESGLRVTTPSRTWLDLGHMLGPAALVALGDQLVRVPRADFEGRSRPYATKGELAAMLRKHRGMRGVAKCREAWADIRVGADSVPETLLRLCLLAYNFPEPELQVRLHEFDPKSFSADLGYPTLRIAIQYDGEHHLADPQSLSDARRDAAFRAAGWIVIVVTADDLRDDFARVRRELRTHLLDRAA